MEGCLQAIERLAVKIRFVGETDRVLEAATAMGLAEALNTAIDAGHLELITSGPSVQMHEEATVVRRKRDASINVAMDLVKRGEAQAVYSAGNSGAVMASAIFRLGRLAGIDRAGHRSSVPDQGSRAARAGARCGRKHGLQTLLSAPVRTAGEHLQP